MKLTFNVFPFFAVLPNRTLEIFFKFKTSLYRVLSSYLPFNSGILFILALICFAVFLTFCTLFLLALTEESYDILSP